MLPRPQHLHSTIAESVELQEENVKELCKAQQQESRVATFNLVYSPFRTHAGFPALFSCRRAYKRLLVVSLSATTRRCFVVHGTIQRRNHICMHYPSSLRLIELRYILIVLLGTAGKDGNKYFRSELQFLKKYPHWK
jgi:hypothetical protein